MRKFKMTSVAKIAGAATIVLAAIATSLALLIPSNSASARSRRVSSCVVPRGSGPGYDASISNQQIDRSYCIVVGERLLVILSTSSPGASMWRDIKVSEPGILQVAPLTLMFSRGVTGMNFRAVRPGTVVLSAQRPACSPVAPGEPTCDAIDLWRATITVRPAPGSHPRSFRSGLFGVVMAGPTCPVERIGHPCPPRPVVGAVDVRNIAGGTVATTHTDGAGRYFVSVSPGSYSLVVVTGSAFPRCPSEGVTVTSGSPQRIDVTCDTGIR
ncbi:MAG TPA: carboxypeptidase-like regulatory domain-containing protein [Acidimicrobiales bacterium]|nr:carboxypeptidase-like regulatory domain-containing protein [Acidimicrobiales bacterium]